VCLHLFQKRPWLEFVNNLFQQEGYNLMAAAFEVYNEKGSGFLKEVYHECMERELTRRSIPWSTKPRLLVYYKGAPLTRFYTPDLMVHAHIIVELKAAKMLLPEHVAQLINYLKATRQRVGYLVNFGAFPKLEWQRFVVDHPYPLRF
jgi:GxxExxY protein